jgi:hypothetical protein
MAPSALTRNRNASKPDSRDNKPSAFTPTRQLNRSPTPSGPPIAGTPLTSRPEKTLTAQPERAPAPTTQPNEPLTAQPEKETFQSTNATKLPQPAKHKVSADEAKQALDATLNYVSEAYHNKLNTLSQAEDRGKAIIETPFHSFEEIGRQLTQVQIYFTQRNTEVKENAKYYEQVIKETIQTSITQIVKQTIETTIKETIAATTKEIIATAVKETIGTTIDETIATTMKKTIEASTKETITTTIKEAIDTTATRTYATIAETPAPGPQQSRDNRAREIQQQNQERRMQRRREDIKFEVTLTAQEAESATKEKLQQQTHAEITAKLQQTVNSQIKENPPQIPGITKLTRSQDIRFSCSTEQEAEKLRNIKWDKYYKGLTVRQTMYGMVIPGISIESIDPNNLEDPELVKQLEDQNKRIGLKIIKMKLLQRKLGENASKFSLIILTSQPEIANRGIKQGIYFNYEHFANVERYSPQLQLIQCYKCTQLRHHASKCRSPHPVCGKCSEHHLTSECQSETYKCALCKGDHPAIVSDCLIKTAERQHLAIRKRNTQAYFDEQ